MQTPSNSARSMDGLTIAQFVVSGLGMVFSVLTAGLLFLVGLVGLFGESIDRANTAAIFGLTWVSILTAALALPSLVFSLRRLRGQGPELPQVKGARLANILILVWPLTLLLGSFVSRQANIAWVLLPLLQLLAVGLPIWWVVEMARRNIPVGSRQRGWGIFNFSLFLTTPIVVMVEMLVFLGMVMLLVLWISTQPELIDELNRLGQQMLTAPPDPEAILEMVRPYLQNPLVIFGVLGLMAGIVPLVEELLKPLALWPLVGRKLTPQQGFVAGALCGAAFALFESLLSVSSPQMDSWAALAAGRAGTGLLHITTTALVGYAMASAWQNGTYLRLGMAYLLAAALHGMWNFLSILTGLNVLMEDLPENLRFLSGLIQAAPLGIVALVIVLFLLLWQSNRTLQKLRQPEAPAAADPQQIL